MAVVYRVEGLHCGNCAASVEKALQAKGMAAKVTVEPPQVLIERALAPTREAIAAIVASAGDYKLGPEITAVAADAKSGLLARLRQAIKGSPSGR